MASYKQLCAKCKKQWVLVSRSQFPICYDCQKVELSKPIKDKAMKKLFNVPEDYYKKSSFLRSIKSNYIKFGKLSDKQIEYFKKTVEELKNPPVQTKPL